MESERLCIDCLAEGYRRILSSSEIALCEKYHMKDRCKSHATNFAAQQIKQHRDAQKNVAGTYAKTKDPSLAGQDAVRPDEVSTRVAAKYLGVGFKFFMDEVLPSDILVKRQVNGGTRIEKKSLEVYKYQALNDNPNIPGIIRAIIRGEVLHK